MTKYYTSSSSIVRFASNPLFKEERYWEMLIWRMTGNLEHSWSGEFNYTHYFYGRLTAFTSVDVRLVLLGKSR